ncbi:OsmC family protein [Galbibacter sp. EGI 63066]|uniref:OsmC family protein n=1 Tax=Galbibacter sp. EGI 63066 TaxID=2993559 RepID=UPI0022497E79|nr:OsmC family protein [Galbibacter sp. EGI 63066]MCX2678457.1 OsmC family protein [Galbibacter sp. EGI 63066]
MERKHHYKLSLEWTGNTGEGTTNYKSYERSHRIVVNNKAVIEGSADPAFRGDPTKHNPEDMFLSSISSCHMLWYLHFCSQAKIMVVSYHDTAEGVMVEESNGKGHFTEVILHPIVKIVEKDKIDLAKKLHHKASEYCFIANSLNFEVKHYPTVEIN